MMFLAISRKSCGPGQQWVVCYRPHLFECCEQLVSSLGSILAQDYVGLGELGQGVGFLARNIDRSTADGEANTPPWSLNDLILYCSYHCVLLM
jgi:hypothetical protein